MEISNYVTLYHYCLLARCLSNRRQSINTWWLTKAPWIFLETQGESMRVLRAGGQKKTSSQSPLTFVLPLRILNFMTRNFKTYKNRGNIIETHILYLFHQIFSLLKFLKTNPKYYDFSSLNISVSKKQEHYST